MYYILICLYVFIFRLNPQLDESIAIDEKSKDLLATLKKYGRDCVALLEEQEPERYKILLNALSGTY